MIPAARRVTSGSLTVVRKAQGLQVTLNAFGSRTGVDGKNFAAVQRGGRGPQHARTIFYTAPSRSSLNSVLQPKEEGEIIKSDGKKDDPLGQPEHAVISTFDLFSIGGPYFYLLLRLLKLLDAAFWRFSWSEQFAHRRPYAGWQHIHQRLEGFGDSGTSTCYIVAYTTAQLTVCGVS